jgi:ubiquinone/menaquinone biosynthesis C-methylase UbiE
MKDYLDFSEDYHTAQFVLSYDELPLWSAMFGLPLLEHIPLRANSCLLDIGCGTGFPLLELAQRLGPSCRAYGVDPWGQGLLRAREKARQWRVENAWLIRGDGARLPFQNGWCDLVVANLGINNFDDPQAVFNECWRITRPAARLVLTTNPKGHMAEFYEVYSSVLVELGNRRALQALQKHLDHRVPVERIQAWLGNAGFRLDHLYEEQATMRFLDGSAFLRHYFIQIGFLDGWKGILQPEEVSETFSRLEDRLNLLAGQHGELAVTIPLVYLDAVKITR